MATADVLTGTKGIGVGSGRGWSERRLGKYQSTEHTCCLKSLTQRVQLLKTKAIGILSIKRL